MRRLLLLFIACPSIAGGQTYWRLPTTTGYGAFGTTLGILAAAPTSYDLDKIHIVALTTVAGGLTGLIWGYKTGASADRRLAQHESLSRRHRNIVRFGTVLTFASAGALAGVMSGPPIVQRNGTYVQAYSSDEAALRGAAVGALIGAAVQWSLDRYLQPSR